MADPLGFVITWTTYGTWLPGDQRGWFNRADRQRYSADAPRENKARCQLLERPVVLDARQRGIVEQTIADHCLQRTWQLHAVNVRSNHVHVVVTADRRPEAVMNELKAWCSRRLNEASSCRGPWWTRHGSTRWLNTESSFWRAVEYVVNYQ